MHITVKPDSTIAINRVFDDNIPGSTYTTFNKTSEKEIVPTTSLNFRYYKSGPGKKKDKELKCFIINQDKIP
ncbi:hypothetical protein L1987_29858 [Smallanthus sonchifolius]|uniref:Uncharacterized protein n=1 Tax=Smallanthus sonchifolius TaxID=185202 RepID=A0ACB9I0M8_9ASTR|nr:hypothetical protein L1987_29858 [Smallanthus sonchifolius]